MSKDDSSAAEVDKFLDVLQLFVWRRHLSHQQKSRDKTAPTN